MLRYLRLDIVQCEVHRLRLLALAFGTVTLCVPKALWDGLLATELCDGSVDGHTPHDGDNPVFLLACVHIEHGLECRSHTYFLFGAKLNYESSMTVNETCAEY